MIEFDLIIIILLTINFSKTTRKTEYIFLICPSGLP